MAPGADLRTDIPEYCVYRDGALVERRTDIRALWRKEHVAFLTGCNLSTDQAMLANEVGGFVPPPGFD